MRYIRLKNISGSQPTNPFVQMLGLVVGIVLFIGAVLLGGIMLAALMGFLLVAGVIIYVRVWWLTRKAVGRQRREDSFIEAEYQVIKPSTRDDERR
jgi:hypothetical protein